MGGRWTMGRRAMDGGRWTAGDGRRAMDGGRWTAGDGRRAISCHQWFVVRRHTVVGRRWSVVYRQLRNIRVENGSR